MGNYFASSDVPEDNDKHVPNEGCYGVTVNGIEFNQQNTIQQV